MVGRLAGYRVICFVLRGIFAGSVAGDLRVVLGMMGTVPEGREHRFAVLIRGRLSR